ncbi:MAG: sulfur carrier protein ThiS [Oscillospiraceae bacterium]|nr:sulfur carrier protein ThiS [Oscillospiraceae bacterium]MBP1568461.1 sulfur carrier protein ThiS [Oscillospiraceae bacterium]MBP1591981.1 sulfur carrier protein ThiS [Oscillospiraceae bacterium]MBQ5336848.1 sulfur carrier protein ThiS [Oscillospiraceae bacterium]
MTITVAGVKKEVNDGLTVSQLLTDEKVETPQYVTVTVNDDFVKSGQFEETVLKDGDNVEFLYFMGGGR